MSDEMPSVFVDEKKLRRQSRRDFVLFGAGTVAALAGLWWIAPLASKKRLLGEHATDFLDTAAARFGLTKERSARFQNRALTFDDDVAEALYSPTRSVRMYRRSDVTPLRNNYNGRTPSPAYIDAWTLTLTGLASGTDIVLRPPDLSLLEQHAQVTRLCCVEGWSAIAGWSGVRFADLLRAYPPAAGSKWIAIESSVNLDGAGNPDPYYVSIDLPTAMHPQTLLATRLNGTPLGPDHGAPLRLVAPMKLGLKNIKAITKIAYVVDQPRDYWADRGYSKYDGL
ncbi:MAG TPA: molybdopterin-dependent oxidoreductase [Thermoanaerobaculia bacterium]|jgi:DMSO/TMAO reductase YedYZ molybdopterin-dependent catalytic subunit|nr:molybdopterin-dependent oxidoreductase [Thermoanaerobaculia bacterium]